jgi:hypothetical protein
MQTAATRVWRIVVVLLVEWVLGVVAASAIGSGAKSAPAGSKPFERQRVFRPTILVSD